MLANFTRLYLLTGEEDFRQRAETLIEIFGPSIAGNPFAYASFLAAIDQHLDPLQAVFLGDPASPGIQALRRAVLSLPAVQPVILYVSPGENLPTHHPAYAKEQKLGLPTLYLCRGTRCAAPVTAPAQAAAAFASLS